MRLGTYFFYPITAQMRLATSQQVSQYIVRHLNFPDCFGGKGFTLDTNNKLQNIFKPFLFRSNYVPYAGTRFTNASIKEEPQCYGQSYCVVNRLRCYCLLHSLAWCYVIAMVCSLSQLVIQLLCNLLCNCSCTTSEQLDDFRKNSKGDLSCILFYITQIYCYLLSITYHFDGDLLRPLTSQNKVT